MYHIFFAAVSADQKTYGLLSVIGMGHDQIFLCMRFQGIFFAIPGIVLGETAGLCGQAFLVPWFMRRFLAADRQVASYLVTQVHLYPFIPLLAALLVVAMVAVGFGMVAWKICRLSPMECLRGISGQGERLVYSGRYRWGGKAGQEKKKPDCRQKNQRSRTYHVAGNQDRMKGTYRIAGSNTRLRTLAWQNQGGYFRKNLLTSVSFLVSSTFFLLVHSLSSYPGFSSADSFLSQKLSCIQVMGDFIGVVVFGVAVIGLFSVAFIHMRERTPELAILQSIGMTKKQLARMFVWESVVQYAEFAATFVLLEIPVWLALYARFSLVFPWSYGIGILLSTFLIYLSGSVVWRDIEMKMF